MCPTPGRSNPHHPGDTIRLYGSPKTAKPINNPLAMPAAHTPPTPDRLALIEQARRRLLHGDRQAKGARDSVSTWVKHSWQRCLAQGLDPESSTEFELVTAQRQHDTVERSSLLIAAAQPTLTMLNPTLSALRYVAILTDHNGIVVQVSGPIDSMDRRITDIARTGIDLSEARVGTTAIGTALHEQRPVWIHRTEHFFASHGSYSCAGAPVAGPDGRCAGMLNLTGVDRPEHPELQLLVHEASREIEHALVQAAPHRWEIRLAWTRIHPNDDANALVCLDNDGWVVSANTLARSMLGRLLLPTLDRPGVHGTEVFAIPFGMLIDAARRPHMPLDIPLWSGLRLSGAVHDTNCAAATKREVKPPRHLARDGSAIKSVETQGLKDMQLRIIHEAVSHARGNVSEAATRLGISRATIYRKLNKSTSGHGVVKQSQE
jgi:sigma-54 dependent transcriptional regulator, acetoin dehydrogenase operon transcriptional activator AcoR